MMRASSVTIEITSKNMFKNDKNFQSINYIQWLLLSIGIFTVQIEKLTKMKKYYIILHRTIIFVLHLWVIICMTIRLCYKDNSLDEKVLILAPISFSSSSLLKYCGLMYRQDYILKTLHSIKTEWKATKNKQFRQIMEDNMKIEKKIIYRFSGLMLTIAIFYNLLMPFTIAKINNNRYNLSERVVMFPGYDVFDDAAKTPYYEILYSSFLPFVYFCFTIHICSCSLGVILVDFMYSQIEIIILQLNNIILGPSQQKNVIKILMSDIVKRHCSEIDFSESTGIILNEICLVDVVAATLIVCTSAHCCFKVWERREIISLITHLITIIGLSLNFLVLCWISEIIKKQFSRVGISSYDIDWYKLPAKTRTALILIIAMAQRPRKLTAGGILDLSFIAFINFVKTVYVYVKVLQS